MTAPPVDTRADAQFKQIRRAYQGRQVPRTLTAAGNALITDYLLACDATSAGFTVTLPTVADARGMSLLIVKTDSSANAVTIDGNGTEKINGALTQALSAQWAQAELYCDGTQWIAFLIGTAAAQGYSSGTWTPTDGSGAALSFTSTATCTWVQVGKMTFASFRITYPATADVSAVVIASLPFASKNVGIATAPVIFSVENVGFPMTGVVVNNGTTFSVSHADTGAAVTNVVLSTATIRGMAIYEAA